MINDDLDQEKEISLETQTHQLWIQRIVRQSQRCFREKGNSEKVNATAEVQNQATGYDGDCAGC